MHNPRGSNNRLNGNGQNVANNARLMDTQNNDKGGYCWGPPLHYYVGSKLMVEWTNQHACAQPKVTCNLILQYMCGPEVRDGLVTTKIPDNANEYNEKVGNVYKYGMHESYQYYQDCKARERNRGLFTADQNMNNRRSARHTRQDNNGQRNGFECPEERDYYPYWHPTPWKDIAVLVTNTSRCDYFQQESENVKPRNYCSDPAENNEASCLAAGAQWNVAPARDLPAPECLEAPWTRDNHLGNTIGGYASAYNWTIPDDPNMNCVLRLRYNISTGDYQGWPDPFVDARLNEDLSPVQQDERVSYYGKLYEMALNTDQYGRTFQDRSHVFEIRERPDNVDDDDVIWNLNVRGKRGNIVQVYPAVEYDFVPNRLHVDKGDYIHFQWTGCDNNPANNDGEGTQQTDRSNIAQILSQNHNKPYDQWSSEERLFDDEEWMHRNAFLDQQNCEETDDEQDVNNCAKLNAAPRYWNGGLHRMNRTGIFHYFCTRNNNFSNRSQKGVIIVDSSSSSTGLWTAIGITAAIGIAALVVGAMILGGLVVYAKTHPGSAVAGTFAKA